MAETTIHDLQELLAAAVRKRRDKVTGSNVSSEDTSLAESAEALMREVTRDDLDAMQAALSHGPNPNERIPREDGFAPPSPFLACRSLAALDLLLANGGDVHSRDDDGDSLGHRLMKFNQAKPGQVLGMVLRMLDAGLDINVPGHCGGTILHWAVLADFPIEELIARGATLGPNVFGDTPLHYAAYHGQTNAMRLLLRAGAEVNTFDSEERTPLWLVVISNQSFEVAEEHIEMLLEAGADVNVSSSEGATLLGDAAEEPEMFALLKKSQAKLAAKSLDAALPAARGAAPGDRGRM